MFAALFGDAAQTADIAYLWPCNVSTWVHWNEVQTQWRVGMGGATGLDYAGVRAYLDEQHFEGDERRDAFKGIRAAEGATLQAWGEKAKRESKT